MRGVRAGMSPLAERQSSSPQAHCHPPYELEGWEEGGGGGTRMQSMETYTIWCSYCVLVANVLEQALKTY